MLQDAHPGRILRKHLEAAAQLHEVETLRSRGVRKVRVLSESRMNDVARIAVYRAVQAFLTDFDLDPDTQRELETRAEAELKDLVSIGLDARFLDDSAPATDAEIEASLDQVLCREQQRLEELAADVVPNPMSGAGDAVEFESRQAIEEVMARDITQLIERDWKQELEQVETSHREQLEILEARIAKLVSALESTDRALAHIQLQAAPGSGELDSAGSEARPLIGPLVEKKSQLLDALFQANVHLQELESDQ